MARLPATLTLFLLLALCGAVTLSAGDVGRPVRALPADSIDRADTSAVDETEPSTMVERLKGAMLTMMTEMIEISEGIRSVDDARAARPRVAAAMRKVTVVVEWMAATSVILDPEAQTALRKVQEDPRFLELGEWGKKAEKLLAERDPEAAAEFKKVSQEEGMKMAETQMAAMRKVMSAQMTEYHEQRKAEDSTSPAARLTNATYDMMNELVAITESIGSVEDAEQARPRIAAALAMMVAEAERMVDEGIVLTPEDLEALESVEDGLERDPRFMALAVRAEAAQKKLESTSRDAAKRYREISEEEGATMHTAFEAVMKRLKGEASVEE